MGIDLQVCLSSAGKSKDKNYMKYLEDGYKLLCRMARRSASEEMKKPPHLTRHHLFDTIGFIDISKDKIYILQHNKNRPDMKDSNYNLCHFLPHNVVSVLTDTPLTLYARNAKAAYIISVEFVVRKESGSTIQSILNAT